MNQLLNPKRQNITISRSLNSNVAPCSKPFIRRVVYPEYVTLLFSLCGYLRVTHILEGGRELLAN